MKFIFLVQKLFSVPSLMRHPAVPLRLKVLPLLALAYLIMPRDLIIDLRWLGLVDDFLVISVLLSIFISRAKRHVDAYEQGRADSIDAEFQVLVQQERAKAHGGRPRTTEQASRDSAASKADDTPKDDLRSRD